MTVFQAGATMPVAAHKSVFDTDSNEIYLDNCATASITNDPNDCITPPVKINCHVQGINGICDHEVYSTTIKWDLEDDHGVTSSHILPKSFYIPKAPNKLMSPQHWAQHQWQSTKDPNRAQCITYADSIVLKWDNCSKTKTIPLDIRGSNVGIMRTTSGYLAFSSFCQQTGRTLFEDDHFPITVNANIIEDYDSVVHPLTDDLDDEHSEEYFPAHNKPMETSFGLNGPPPDVVPNEEDTMPQDASAELLRMHHRYGHAPMHKLQRMAQDGILPSRLATSATPLCTSCLNGKASCRPWRDKPSAQQKPRTVTRPGQCVSVDQLVSTTPGLVAQLRGRPTTKRYNVATIFVDHYSGLSFVNIQKTTSAEI